MDTTTQVVLIIMVLVLGSTLSLVGVMLFLVLKDFRETLARFNEVLVDVKEISGRFSITAVQIESLTENIVSSFSQFQHTMSSPLSSMIGVYGFIQGLFKAKKGGDNNG